MKASNRKMIQDGRIFEENIRNAVFYLILYCTYDGSCTIFFLVLNDFKDIIDRTFIIFKRIADFHHPVLKLADFKPYNLPQVIVGQRVEIYYIVEPVQKFRWKFILKLFQKTSLPKSTY